MSAFRTKRQSPRRCWCVRDDHESVALLLDSISRNENNLSHPFRRTKSGVAKVIKIQLKLDTIRDPAIFSMFNDPTKRVMISADWFSWNFDRSFRNKTQQYLLVFDTFKMLPEWNDYCCAADAILFTSSWLANISNLSLRGKKLKLKKWSAL